MKVLLCYFVAFIASIIAIGLVWQGNDKWFEAMLLAWLFSLEGDVSRMRSRLDKAGIPKEEG
jgi:hypothetical protein